MRKLQPAPSDELVRRLAQAGYLHIVGADEVGRGALAGPLVVAAVEIDIVIAGVNDSKLLTFATRHRLSEEIHRTAKQIGIGAVTNIEIDTLGLAKAQQLAYERALEGLTHDIVLTDNISLPGHKHLRTIRGDQLIYQISAASILAKVHRDNLMTNLHNDFPEYGWDTNVGYGTAKHLDAIHRLGPTELHRRSFLRKGTAP